MAALTLSGCATSIPDVPVDPIVGPPVVEVSTDYSELLGCMAGFIRSQSYPAPRIAVGHISDLTGASDAFVGRRLTQGATLMAMTALSDAGVRLVERYDMGVLQVDLDYANAGLIKDSKNRLRKVSAGQIQGADLYVIGGLTEFNPNVVSGGANVFVGGSSGSAGALAIGKNYYIIDVGMDLRLVDARSSDVLAVRSFRKQIVGYENELGTFDLIGSVIGDVGLGKKALEPVQTAVRSMIDRAMFEFVAGLYGLDKRECARRMQAVSNQRSATHPEEVRGQFSLKNRMAQETQLSAELMRTAQHQPVQQAAPARRTAPTRQLPPAPQARPQATVRQQPAPARSQRQAQQVQPARTTAVPRATSQSGSVTSAGAATAKPPVTARPSTTTPTFSPRQEEEETRQLRGLPTIN